MHCSEERDNHLTPRLDIVAYKPVIKIKRKRGAEYQLSTTVVTVKPPLGKLKQKDWPEMDEASLDCTAIPGIKI